MTRLPSTKDPSDSGSRRGPSQPHTLDPMLYHGQVRLRGKGHLASGRRRWIDRLPGANRLEKRICLALCSGIVLLIAVMIWATFFMHGS
ncbi:MAG: hypothetical protein FJ385_02495 [Verrucomicrobia bacterium]|nr:hypothetical protein [Verrucomicrobiota bacterium]